MNNDRRIEKAKERALQHLDYIIECYPALNFVEIIGRAGGDTVTYRIYDDGRMYER